jgi:hypothetical protein
LTFILNLLDKSKVQTGNQKADHECARHSWPDLKSQRYIYVVADGDYEVDVVVVAIVDLYLCCQTDLRNSPHKSTNKQFSMLTLLRRYKT